MKKHILLVAVVLLVIGIPVFKKVFGGGVVKQVQVAALETHDIKSSIIASGNLSHEEKVQLSTEVIGKVKAIFVKEGDKVSKGQLLLQIDDEAYLSAMEQNQAAVRMQQLTITHLQANYENLQAQWQRKKVLYDKHLLDQQSFDAINLELASADYQVKSGRQQLIQAEAQLAQAENNLAKTRAYSPIEGVVTSLSIKVGETAIAGTMNFAASGLMTIANPESLQVEVNVDEADIANVSIGQHVEVVAIAHADEPIDGVVDFIAESAAVASGRTGLSFAVKIRFEQSPRIKLWPGMTARAEIFTSEESTKLAVPMQAIISETGENNAALDDEKAKNEHNEMASSSESKKLSNKSTQHFIFVVDGNKAKRIPVSLGMSDDEYQEISSLKPNDLTSGAKVILGPDRILRFLKDGESVSISEDISEVKESQ